MIDGLASAIVVTKGYKQKVMYSVPFKVFDLGPIVPNLTTLEGLLHQND